MSWVSVGTPVGQQRKPTADQPFGNGFTIAPPAVMIRVCIYDSRRRGRGGHAHRRRLVGLSLDTETRRSYLRNVAVTQKHHESRYERPEAPSRAAAAMYSAREEGSARRVSAACHCTWRLRRTTVHLAIPLLANAGPTKRRLIGRLSWHHTACCVDGRGVALGIRQVHILASAVEA